jgi:hypothetical protein
MRYSERCEGVCFVCLVEPADQTNQINKTNQINVAVAEPIPYVP